jgi:hypothetical protein
MPIEIINSWSVYLKHVTQYETKALEVIIGSHNNKVVFNVISFFKTLSSLGYLRSLCIIHEWFNIIKKFILES